MMFRFFKKIYANLFFKKLDLILDPEKESLIIIQQIQGLNYGLEGGDGPCMIEIIPESDQKEHEQEKEKFPPKLHFDLEMNIKKMN